MKHVNLNALFAELIGFNINNYDISHIVPTDAKEPIDMLINAYPKEGINYDLVAIDGKVKSCITGDVKQTSVRLIDDKIQIYIEF